ncbi:MAG: formylmethanofuran dehydrogenase subunit A [Phycisphaeraceae bacterium]|nr:formylmethanofuran dehydrogenase subunit A [Phycisphaeraceae bacterium]
MTQALRIADGKVHDPRHNLRGEVRDILIRGNRVVSSLNPLENVQTIDAKGLVVMPGGIEMHAHVASATANEGRRLQSACGWDTVIPTAPETGRLYAKLGYTTVMEAAVAPAAAESAHRQLDDLPILDAGLLVLMGNHEALIRHIQNHDKSAALNLVRSLLRDHRGYGIKAVNPVGVAAWRRDASRRHVHGIDDALPGEDRVSPRIMLEWLTEAQESLHLPHPTHIHGPQLGEPGNVEITTRMIHALDGRRAHLAHLQYYAYDQAKRGGLKSAVPRLLDALRQHPTITADMGLVAFGPAFTATADLPLEHGLFRKLGSPARPGSFREAGNEDCFGLMPLNHQRKQSYHAIQWAAGLELILLADDLTRFALTVDHPNGGSFLNYPHLIALLMSKARRDEELATCHRHATNRTGLASLARELSLHDIAVLTRDAPARALGLADRGHLGDGAMADVTLYRDQTGDPQTMFEKPRLVLKSGQIVVDDGQIIASPPTRRLLPASLEE